MFKTISGPVSVAQWITYWCLKQKSLDSRFNVSINTEMKVHPADKVQNRSKGALWILALKLLTESGYMRVICL